jgi:ABC-type transport system involved in multi-copper enzyme maturation permease subunit
VIRFAWLQSRTQTLVMAAFVVALAILATITGVHLAHLYTSIVTHCETGCGLADAEFLTHDPSVLDHALTILSQLVAPVLGIFWGAPLVTRELETGTYRMAWTQSVSRSRWLITKLAVVGLATVLVAGAVTLTITWWYRVLDPLSSNKYAIFDERDIVPIGYAIFAFASGAFIGAIIRRTLPAMATTLVFFVAVRVAITQWVRPHLLTPIHQTMSLLSSGGLGIQSDNGSTFKLVAQGSAPHNAWALSTKFVTNSGHIASSNQLSTFIRQYCPKIGPPPSPTSPGRSAFRAPSPQTFHACFVSAAQHFQLRVAYLPANRYWTLQWLETGIFVALALLAAAACYWWVTRRTT